MNDELGPGVSTTEFQQRTSVGSVVRALRPGRRRYAAMGYTMRVVRALPRSFQRAMLDRVAGGELPPVPDFVRMLEAAGQMPDPGPDPARLLARFPELASVEVTQPVITGPGGAVPARLYRRPGVVSDPDRAAALVWVHGGGFVAGTLEMAEAHWVGLALAARGIPVLSLDYRKSLRGVRFPAASDDVLAGWCWAVDNADQLGLPPARLHLGGASAGGNLTAGVAKRLRDGGGPSPSTVVLAYPLAHPELPDREGVDLSAIRDVPGAVFFTPGWVRDLTLNYAGDGATLADPYAFPANGDVSGLPPTFVLTCENDSLRSSGEAYADQLAAAGVDVTLQMEPGAAHGDLNEPFTPEAVRSLDRIADWLGMPR
jgi:acetyl esterase/lipase